MIKNGINPDEIITDERKESVCANELDNEEIKRKWGIKLSSKKQVNFYKKKPLRAHHRNR